jgi:hypothetical protein
LISEFIRPVDSDNLIPVSLINDARCLDSSSPSIHLA